MAIVTRTVRETNLKASELNTTFEWETQGADTCVVTASIVTGAPDTDPTDPQFTIEESYDGGESWGNLVGGATTLNHNAKSSELTITAPLMRVRTTTANSSAFRSAITVALRKDLGL